MWCRRGPMRVAATLCLAAVASTALPDHKFHDDHIFDLTARQQVTPPIQEPAVPLFHNGYEPENRVDDPNTPGDDLFRVVDVSHIVQGTSDWPTTWADIIANTFLRPTYQWIEVNGDVRRGKTGSFGTSVVGSISFRPPASDLTYIPTVSRAAFFTGNPDRIYSVIDAKFVGADDGTLATVASQRTFPHPELGTTTTELLVTVEVTDDIPLDLAKRGNDAFRFLTLSSMFLTSTRYDANVLRFEDSDGSVRTVRLTDDTPRPAHLLPAPVELGSWFELVKEPGSTYNPTSPSIRVRINGVNFDPPDGLAPRLGIQGYLWEKKIESDDSLTVWVEWLDAPATVEKGTSFQVDVQILATPPRALPSATIHVDDDNTTGDEDGSEERPFNTIQEGVWAAVDGATVKVAKGTYTGDVLIGGKSVTIQGGYPGGTYPGTGDFDDAKRDPDPSTNQTVIDGRGAPSKVECQDDAARGSRLASFSLRHGGAFRGGVWLERTIAGPGP